MATLEDFSGADYFDLRDVIARVEQLEDLEQPGPVDTGNPDDDDKSQDELLAELATLRKLLADAKGSGGGDHKWRGDWYPVTLVRDSYFEDFARDEAEQLDLIKDDAQWPYNHIDWEKAAEQLQTDYSSVKFDGHTYWYR